MEVAMKMKKCVMCWFAFQKEKQRYDLRSVMQRRRVVREIDLNSNVLYSNDVNLRHFAFMHQNSAEFLRLFLLASL